MKRLLLVSLIVGLFLGTVGGATTKGQDMTTLLSKFLNDLWAGYISMGYTANATAPAATLCDVAGEANRLYWDSTNDKLYACSGASGWVTAYTSSPTFTQSADTATLGSDLVTNGTFTGNADGWTTTGWTYGSNKICHNTDNTNPLRQSITVTSGNTYLIKWTSSTHTASTFTVKVGTATAIYDDGTDTAFAVASLGSQARTVVAAATGAVNLDFTPAANAFDGCIDTVSVQEVTLESLPPSIYIRSADGTVDHPEIRTSATTMYGTFMGYQAGSSWAVDSATYSYGNNTGIGQESLSRLTTGCCNTAVGGWTLRNLTVGSRNTAVGEDNLQQLTTGADNSSFGQKTMRALTTGKANTAVGTAALNTETNGTGNVAVGMAALYTQNGGDYNVAVGRNAGYAMTTALGTVAIGLNALRSHTSANYSVAVGDGAGYSSTGASSVYLGPFAGYYETGGSKLFIDNAQRSNEADGRIKALIYGVFHADVASQSLTVNAGQFTVTGDIKGTTYSVGATAGADCTSAAAVTVVKGIVTVCSIPVPDPLTQEEVNELRGLLAVARAK